jgi:hypothetical protein
VYFFVYFAFKYHLNRLLTFSFLFLHPPNSAIFGVFNFDIEAGEMFADFIGSWPVFFKFGFFADVLNGLHEAFHQFVVSTG